MHKKTIDFTPVKVRERNRHMKKRIFDQLNSESPPKEVKLWFYITKVTDINTVNSSFSAIITLSSSWIEDKPSENITIREEGSSSWKLPDFKWYPQLRFLNVLDYDENFKSEWFRVIPSEKGDINECDPGIANGSLKDWKGGEYDECVTKDTDGIVFKDSKKVRVSHYVRYKIKLSEDFMLQNFPVDLQDLHIHVSSSWDSTKVVLTFSEVNACACDPNALDCQEFEMHSPRLISYNKDSTDEDLPLLSKSIQSITGVRYSRAYIALTVSRKPMYYVWNVGIMLFILGTLSFSVFTIDIDIIEDRLSNLFTLTLALVAFKLVLANDQPNISYLSMLDAYALASTLIIFIIGITLSILNIYKEDIDSQHSDRWLATTSLFLWGGVNIFFSTNMIIQWKWRTDKIKTIDDNFSLYRKSIHDKRDCGSSSNNADDEGFDVDKSWGKPFYFGDKTSDCWTKIHAKDDFSVNDADVPKVEA